MECTPLSQAKRILSVLSGPMGGFLLIMIGKWFPEAALCSWILSVYNLIPVEPLDGGRILALLLRKSSVHYLVERVILCALTLIALYCLVFLRLGVLPIVVVIGIWLRNRKFPCKPGHCKVQ